MSTPENFNTRKGRRLRVIGDPALLTMERLEIIGRRADEDPRIASLSIVADPTSAGSWVRATAPAGCLVVIAEDVASLTAGLPDDPGELRDWARRASDHGLWHDWWCTRHADVDRASVLLPIADMDLLEATDPSSTRHDSGAVQVRPTTRSQTGLQIAVDATWLGPYQTGAQVLTTAAVTALAHQPSVSSIRLTGLTELPDYAKHLLELPNLQLATAEQPEQADVIWFPNQIDARSNIGQARELGRRVITTYLDLIAYDIPRYHASPEAWGVYRALQRRIALSVDGITTISADVATRLLEEVPRLDPERVRPIPLGLDHITAQSARLTPPPAITELATHLRSRRFLLVLGNDFAHKNRDFAIAVWQEVLRRGVSCDLVLAGLHVRSSSSATQESELLRTHVDLRGRAHTLGHVDEATRAWLLANASAVLYPSSAEGFGLVPYEAAILGTPTTFASFGPLREIAQPNDARTAAVDFPTHWTIDAFATDVVALLNDPVAQRTRLELLQRAISQHTWADFAAALVEMFTLTLQRPPVLTSAVASGAAEAAALASIMNSRTWRATEPLRRAAKKLRRDA
ncbi:MAG: glycosyltransferase [Actinomycetales bacterium]